MQRHVAERLAHHGLAARWIDPVCAALDEVLATPLPALDGGAPFPLRAVPRERWIAEMGFFLPVGGGMVARGDAHLGAAALAGAFRRHAAAALAERYAERIAALGFVPVEGFLRGYIDLVFEHRGRYYLVDYKSNHLGARPDDYAPPHLERAMLDHHYVLQYHLYTVALDRLLAQRLPRYDYERHFGGVYYLFLRGMSPGHGDRGVFHDRPPRALVDALARALEPERT
jgi:exodeoxyribonuclease V beta subunit